MAYQAKRINILYYIPGRATKDEARKILPNRFEQTFSRADVMRGPDGQPAGSIYARTDHRLKLDLAAQDWHASACGQFWFGWWRDARPEPADLQKQETIAGDLVNGWLVPRVRKCALEDYRPVYFETLPQRARWNGDRFVESGVVDRFASVAELAHKVHDELRQMYTPPAELVDGQSWRLSLPPSAPQLAAQVLQVNHLVGMDEIGELQAFEMAFDPLANILRTFVSYDQYESLLSELIEKKTAELVSV